MIQQWDQIIQEKKQPNEIENWIKFNNRNSKVLCKKQLSRKRKLLYPEVLKTFTAWMHVFHVWFLLYRKKVKIQKRLITPSFILILSEQIKTKHEQKNRKLRNIWTPKYKNNNESHYVKAFGYKTKKLSTVYNNHIMLFLFKSKKF